MGLEVWGLGMDGLSARPSAWLPPLPQWPSDPLPGPVSGRA